jgi:hypothetical protein
MSSRKKAQQSPKNSPRTKEIAKGMEITCTAYFLFAKRFKMLGKRGWQLAIERIIG